MKKTVVTIFLLCGIIYSQDLISPQLTFFQPNNINTIFYNNGIFNYDKFAFPSGGAGFVWPVSAVTRLTADFGTGIWIGTKAGPQRELRLAGCIFNSLFTAGNIPVIGQVPPASVCNDSSFKPYLVNLADQSLINGGIRQKVAGGRTYTFTYDSWANWPISKGAPYVEVNNVPGYQPGWNSDRPGIGNTTARPDEIAFAVYMDYTNCTNNIHTSEFGLPGGTLPLGVEIQQLTFGFTQPGFQDVYFMKWRIINKSSLQWDSTYIGIVDDGDLGYASDDAAGCDSARQLASIYNFDNNDEGYYGNAPPALGFRFLECPINYTGNNFDTAHLPYGNFAGYKLMRMSVYNTFRSGGNMCNGFPNEPIPSYNYLSGTDGCGNPIINRVYNYRTTFKYNNSLCPRTGWYDSVGSDKRQIMTTGPIHFNSGEDRIFLAAVMIARGSDNLNSVCQLITLSDNVMEFYRQSFGGDPIGISSSSTEVPDRFMLYQNYPNPFNPTTKIRFSIPLLREMSEGRGVLLKVYDALGREISTLVNENLTPGTYEIDWDGTNYSSGVYYYRLTIDDASAPLGISKKMVLIK